MENKKPVESVRTIGTECLSLLEWTVKKANTVGLAIGSKISGIDNNVNKGAAWAGLVLASWILWPVALVICLSMVSQHVRKDK